MNGTLQTLRNRRSIRNFKPEQITASELEAILEAGAYAPSSANQQSWHFTVVRNADLLDRLSAAIKVLYTRMNIPALQKIGGDERRHLFYHAPIVVVISGNQAAWTPVEDASLAAGNMMIAAASLDVGPCWISGLPQLAESGAFDELLRELCLPDGYKPLCSVALGYNAGEQPAAHARKENTVNYVG